jgi:Tfp pilus assembly protein PilP
MNLKRTTTIVVVGAALAAWLAGAATSNHVIPSAPVVQHTSIEERGAELASEIERLHERLAPVATPRMPGRNLFAFRAVAARPAAPIAPAPRPAITEAAPAPIALPSLKLSGIAEDAGADGPIRIAFISGEGQLFMVKEGETVTRRYRVTKISADVVELVDLVDNSTRRLALR